MHDQIKKIAMPPLSLPSPHIFRHRRILNRVQRLPDNQKSEQQIYRTGSLDAQSLPAAHTVHALVLDLVDMPYPLLVSLFVVIAKLVWPKTIYFERDN